jgi:hypothetical protein
VRETARRDRMKSIFMMALTEERSLEKEGPEFSRSGL